MYEASSVHPGNAEAVAAETVVEDAATVAVTAPFGLDGAVVVAAAAAVVVAAVVVVVAAAVVVVAVAAAGDDGTVELGAMWGIWDLFVDRCLEEAQANVESWVRIEGSEWNARRLPELRNDPTPALAPRVVP